MYVIVEGARLSTPFADAPRATLSAPVGSTTELVLEFASSPLGPDASHWVTVVRYRRVLDVRFFDFELGLKDQLTNPEDLEYALIEITDSDLLRAFDATGALDRTAMPILAVKDLRHYRIAFDDHGIYDVVCVGIEIAERREGAGGHSG